MHASGTAGATVRFLAHRGDESTGPTGRAPLARALRAIGYRPRVTVVRSREKFFRQLGHNRWHMSADDWIADFPSPSEFFSLLTCGSPLKGGGFCNARLDRLVARAQRLQVINPAAAHAANSRAQADRLAVDQAALAPVVTNASVEVLSPRTGNFTLDASSLPRIDRLWVR